jgi:DNA polymerase elongation subunit (family B)
LTINYLIDASILEKENAIKLSFFNPSKNLWEEIVDYNYRPYFFIPYPIPKDALEVMKDLKFDMQVLEKVDLFSGEPVKLAKIELRDFSGFLQISRKFSQTWESEVSIISSYMYDKGLVFGAQYKIKDEKIVPVVDVSKEDLEVFRKAFLEIRKADPKKYALIKRFFVLCSAPIPDVDLTRFGLEKIELDQLQVMFTLARIANLPVPKTYRNRRVSDWIKSILYNYLRENNILIPTAKELRRGEKTHSVKGALTFAPESGVHFNVVVVDFDSMYPSLIDSYNLSHETIDCDDKNCQDNKVPERLNCVCTNRRGVYSILVGSIKDLRIHWFKPRSKNKSLSAKDRELSLVISDFLKLILVSSYGVVIRIHGISRSSLGEAITAYGRYSLKTAYKIAKDGGLVPIYGDTDSLFLENPTQKEVDWLIKEVKEKLKLDLSVEVRYSLCVLPKAAKAYFGIKEDGTVDIKGLTAIKSNSPKYIQDVFKNCTKQLKNVKNQTDFIQAKNKIEAIVKRAVEDLKLEKVPISNLEYSVEIHEDPKKQINAKTLHQPYQAAIQLINKGRSVKRWDVVHFIKVKPFRYSGKRFTVKPTEFVRSIREVNIEDYVRNLRTALDQTFKPMDISFSDHKLKARTLLDF